MNLSRKNLTYIAVGIIVLGVVAYFFIGRSAPEDTITVFGDAPTSLAQTTFLNLAAQLDPVSFDATVLSDPRFSALQDIHTSIVPEAQGRIDPFAPLSGVAAPR